MVSGSEGRACAPCRGGSWACDPMEGSQDYIRLPILHSATSQVWRSLGRMAVPLLERLSRWLSRIRVLEINSSVFPEVAGERCNRG